MKITVTEISDRDIDAAVQMAIKLSSKSNEQVIEVANEALFAIESSAKINAPVDTGRLRASIHVVPIGAKVDNFSYTSNAGKNFDGSLDVVRSHGGKGVGFVGTNVEYAAEQEFGGGKKKGHHYLSRAFKQIIPRLKSELNALKKW